MKRQDKDRSSRHFTAGTAEPFARRLAARYIYIGFIFSAYFHGMAFIYCYTWLKKSNIKVFNDV